MSRRVFLPFPNVSLLSNDSRPVIRMNSKRKARKRSDSSTSGSSPVEKRAREILSSSNSSPERLVVVKSEVLEVVEMTENLESKVDLILARLETMYIEGNYSQGSWSKQVKLVRHPFSAAPNLISYLLIESKFDLYNK